MDKKMNDSQIMIFRDFIKDMLKNQDILIKKITDSIKKK